jgi:hypothetical protein
LLSQRLNPDQALVRTPTSSANQSSHLHEDFVLWHEFLEDAFMTFVARHRRQTQFSARYGSEDRFEEDLESGQLGTRLEILAVVNNK